MKISTQKILQFFRLKSNGFTNRFAFSPALADTKGFLINNIHSFGSRLKSFRFEEALTIFGEKLTHFTEKVRSIGFHASMDELEKTKLGIFNQLNFFGLVGGIVAPIAGIFDHSKLPALAWIIACSPAIISVLVFWLNSKRRYEIAMISYFILYPVFTSLVYVGGINLGIQLFFILYGILSVFFIPRISHMLFSIAFSMVSYFMLAVVLKNYQYQLEKANYTFYLFNQALAIVFIFYGLFIIKRENTGYQFSILAKNRELHRTNLEIEKQRGIIADKAAQLEQQTIQLAELNSLKNKLFSVISHDLKTPMYALRNLFQNMRDNDLPPQEIKDLLPDVVNELNYTTGLMENLLQWARSQMQANSVRPQELDVQKLSKEVTQLLRIQAEAKHIHIKLKVNRQMFVYADKDMINLVLRNLVSNAIKFTPEKGEILIEAEERPAMIEISVRDNGVGISQENIQKLFNEYYTSKGTANESGTGLGLMLCKEFLTRNGGQMKIQSEEGKGSVFSFTLPTANTQA